MAAVQDKIKNLTHKYKMVGMSLLYVVQTIMVVLLLQCLSVHQVRDRNDSSGKDRISYPFFKEMDAVLGTRAISCAAGK